MRWFTAAVVAVAVSIIVLAFVNGGPRRYAPGPLEIRIVERSCRATGLQYLLTFDDQRLLTSDAATVTLKEGAHRLRVEGWPRELAASSRRTWTLHVDAEAATPNPVFEVRFGDGFFKRLFSRGVAPVTAPWSTPPVVVFAQLPDGTPAAGAWYTCGTDVLNLDARGHGECPGRFNVYDVHVGLGALGASSPEGLTSPFTPVLGPDAINFRPKVRATSGKADEGLMLELTVNSKDQMLEQHYEDLAVVMPGLLNQRAIACLRLGNESVCDVIPADAGLYEPELVLGEAAQLTFTATLAGAPMNGLIVYLDRVRTDVRGSVASLMTAPGRHVLVLNSEDGEARYERVVEVAPGQKLDLGTLALE